MRLTRGATPRGAPFTITFDGDPIAALPGETVAAALSAAGILAFRHTASGAPRGLHCGMGACWDCLVTVDGRMGQRACMTKAKPGMLVTGAVPDRPAPLAGTPRDGAVLTPDLLVVGAGPAGLAAAIAAAEAGCDTLLLDERAEAGGQYLKPAPAHHLPRPDRQHRQGDTLRTRALAAGVTILHGAVAWGPSRPARSTAPSPCTRPRPRGRDRRHRRRPQPRHPPAPPHPRPRCA
ncbi:(2Fe-2S)-binding protein [Roseomonas sp. CCTCC AB2023176]|uniref:(2Fe-2S)-binding protein n=1 Tax=Roseomonas sp. CCTCC AB2023176 TaxID=3342640 RepID=UPI0035DE04BA